MVAYDGHRDLLVGRDRELTALAALIDDARAGRGGAVLIEGSGGLGKSALLAATTEQARASGVRVLSARAVQGERDYPFGVVLRLFERELARPGSPAYWSQFAGAAELVEPLFAGRFVADDQQAGFALLHGLFWLLVNLTQDGPAILVVDDAHSADEGSLAFLRFLLPRLDGLPIGVVIALRPATRAGTATAEAQLRADLQGRIVLGPLSHDAVAALVRAAIPRADTELCTVCAEVTRGNPFYLREVLLALGGLDTVAGDTVAGDTVAGDTVAGDAVAAATELSQRLREIGFATISRAALFRLARLGPDAIALARALAVFGDATPLRRAATLAELPYPVAARAAEVLAAEQIVTLGPELNFGHPLIGQSIADELPVLERAQAQARAARLLAAEGAAASLVAAHLLLAPATGDPWVVAALRESARQARARGIAAVAVRELQRALEEPPDSATRPAVLAELGSAELADGQPGALEHLSEAITLLVGPARIDAQRGLARALARAGRRLEAAQLLEAALVEDGGQADPDLELGLVSDYLVNALLEPGVRQRALHRTARFTEPAPAGSTPAERALLSALALRSAQDAESSATSIELARRAWSDGALLADQGVDGPGWLMVVWSLQLADDFVGAEQVTAQVMERARTAGSLDGFATASYSRARVQFDLGSLTQAQADAEQAIEAGRSGWSRFHVAAHALHALVLIERHELERAEATLDEVRSLGPVSGLDVPWLHFSHGRLQLARNQPQPALDSFRAAGDWLATNVSVEHTVLPWRAYGARAAVALGNLTLARTLAEPLVERGERAGLPVTHAHGLWLLALSGDAGLRIERLRTACRLLASAGAALEHTDAQIDLGASLRRRGERVAAREPLAEALERAVRLGAARHATRARAELAAAGGRPRTEARTGPDALTPSERRVAELAAGGLSNAQIAQALFVTPKTVEYHLGHVYQKLSIAGRGELARFLSGG